ncbi:hypothetical protein BHJ80_02320 [Escherichia coli]|nr:hypothetical protein BHJ80_02320 [Escherichia coli]
MAAKDVKFGNDARVKREECCFGSGAGRFGEEVTTRLRGGGSVLDNLLPFFDKYAKDGDLRYSLRIRGHGKTVGQEIWVRRW